MIIERAGRQHSTHRVLGIEIVARSQNSVRKIFPSKANRAQEKEKGLHMRLQVISNIWLSMSHTRNFEILGTHI